MALFAGPMIMLEMAKVIVAFYYFLLPLISSCYLLGFLLLTVSYRVPLNSFTTISDLRKIHEKVYLHKL